MASPGIGMALQPLSSSSDSSYGGRDSISGRSTQHSSAVLVSQEGSKSSSTRAMQKDRNGRLIQQMTKITMETAIGKNSSASMASRLAQGVLEDVRDADVVVADENAQQWWEDSGGRLPSLQRILLEARWSFRQEVEWSCRENINAEETEQVHETISSGSSASVAESEVVRSGKPSARQRRLAARQEEDSEASSSAAASSKASASLAAASFRSRKWNSRTQRSMKGFVDFYIKYAESHDMSEEERLTLWEQIRNASELLREHKRLQTKLGYEPSMHQLAEASGMSLRSASRKITEGVAARKRMIRTNMRLVVSIARRYENMGVEIADLIQEGTFGLVQGLEKFEVERGFRFSTYAYWWIFQAIIRALDKRGKIVRYPFHLCETIRKINRLKNKLNQEGKDEALSVETIADELKLPRAKIEYALQVSNYRLTSLDRHVSNRTSFEKGDPLETFMVDPSDENQPWKMAERIEAKKELDRLLETKLDARERKLIRKRFALDPKHTSPLSRYEIGTSCGLSSERIRQLENDAMSKLRASKESLSIDFLLSSSYDTILW